LSCLARVVLSCLQVVQYRPMLRLKILKL